MMKKARENGVCYNTFCVFDPVNGCYKFFSKVPIELKLKNNTKQL
jgi:hypothetical protein